MFYVNADTLILMQMMKRHRYRPEQRVKQTDDSYLPVDNPVIRKLSVQSCVIIRYYQTRTLKENTHSVKVFQVFN